VSRLCTTRIATEGTVNRYYDPNTAQFMSVDPDVTTTLQPYAFTGDDPLNATDPLGLCFLDLCQAAKAVVKAAKKVAHVIATRPVEAALAVLAAPLLLPVNVEIGGGAYLAVKHPKAAITVLVVAATIPLDETGAGEAIDAEAFATEEAGGGPSFITNGNGESVPVPEGATGPQPTANGKGFQFSGGSGGNGLNSNVFGVRIMDPATSGGFSYPNGYVSYFNESNQTVDPFNGQTIGRSDPFWHWEWTP
jgi:hypothetical protein